MQLYKIFLFIVIIGKIIYIASTFNLQYNLENTDKNSEIIKKEKQQNHIIYIISDTLMSILLIYLFLPSSCNNVTIGYGEKISLFTLGIMNLLQFEWLEPLRYFRLH
jgi:hypothetical protein